MTRWAWSIAGTLVAGQVVADVVGPFDDLDPRRVLALLAIAVVVAFIRSNEN